MGLRGCMGTSPVQLVKGDWSVGWMIPSNPPTYQALRLLLVTLIQQMVVHVERSATHTVTFVWIEVLLDILTPLSPSHVAWILRRGSHTTLLPSRSRNRVQSANRTSRLTNSSPAA